MPAAEWEHFTCLNDVPTDMAECGGKGAEHSYNGMLPIKLCLQHSCHAVCKMFLESSVEHSELEAAKSYLSIIGEMINLVFSSGPKSQLVTSVNEYSYEPLDERDLQLLTVLATFCVKIWSRDLEVADDPGQFKSLNDYIEYFFDMLSCSDEVINDEERESEASRNKRKKFIIRYLNSQRLLLKNLDSANTYEVSSMFNVLKEKKLVLYPREVKKLILNPHFEVPNFLDYASFFLAVKQIVKDVLEKCEGSYLARVQSILSKSKIHEDMHFSGGDVELFHEILEVFGDRKDRETQEDSAKGKLKKTNVFTQEEVPSSSQNNQPEESNVEPVEEENEMVQADSTLNGIKMIKQPNRLSSRKRRIFTQNEENWLREGIKKYGVGNWKVILESYPFHNRTSVNLKDKYRNMLKNNQF